MVMKRSKATSRPARSAKKPSKPVRRQRDQSRGIDFAQTAAFQRVASEAQSCCKDPERLQRLVIQAREKINLIPRGPYAETWPYLMAMIRLLAAYCRDEYRDVSGHNLQLVVAALVYFVSPFDVIPDSVPIFGHLDDALVVRLALKTVGADLDTFMAWETSRV
jgi:uncharacterized membrane protein YkvA (DUF1232 family)